MKQDVSKLSGIFLGEVVSIADPKKIGRLKIKVDKLNNSDTKEDFLNWYLPAYPITAAQNGGIGDSGIPMVGSKVVVQFLDGDYLQGIYTHVIPGKDDLPNPDDYYNEDDPEENIRTIKMISGHEVKIEKDTITVTQSGGDNEVKIEMTDGYLNITSDKEINIDAEKIFLQDGKNVGNFIINSDKFKQYFQNHIHQTGVGPSSPPIANHGFVTKKDWYTTTIEVKT